MAQLISAAVAAELTKNPSDTAAILKAACLSAIATQIVTPVGNPAVTAAVSTGAATEGQLLAQFDELHRLGYGYTLGASSFTINWQR